MSRHTCREVLSPLSLCVSADIIVVVFNLLVFITLYLLTYLIFLRPLIFLEQFFRAFIKYIYFFLGKGELLTNIRTGKHRPIFCLS